MNETDFKELLEIIARVNSEVTTPEQARQFLHDDSYLEALEQSAKLKPKVDA